MKIETKFDIGKSYYMPFIMGDILDVDCTFCGGTGTTNGLEGSSEFCPKCGTTPKKYVTKWEVKDTPTRIIGIRISLDGSLQYLYHDNYGVPEHLLFENLSDAQKECEKRNTGNSDEI